MPCEGIKVAMRHVELRREHHGRSGVVDGSVRPKAPQVDAGISG